MGLFSGIKDVFLGKKKKSSGYRSTHSGEYEGAARDMFADYFGATANYEKDKNGAIKKDKYGNPIVGSYNYSNAYKPTTVKSATSQYNFKPIDQAVKAYGANNYGAGTLNATYDSEYSPTAYKSTYNPQNYNATKFSFASAPEQYYQGAFDLAAKNINRASQGELARTQQALGARNPGLLMRAAEANSRAAGEQTQDLATKLSLEKMQQETQLAKEQQIAQAEEDFRAAGYNDEQARALAAEKYKESSFAEDQDRFAAGEAAKEYESNAALERAKADERFRNIGGMRDTASNKIATQSGLVQNDRAQQQQMWEYLMNLLSTSMQSNPYKKGGGRTGGLLGGAMNVANTAAQFMPG